MSSTIAIIWTAVIVLVAPIAGLFARKPLTAAKKPRILIYVGSAVNLIVLGALTIVIDMYCDRRTLHTLTPSMSISPLIIWSLALSAVLIVITIGVFALRQKLNRPPSSIVM
jgi:hypothetical protein